MLTIESVEKGSIAAALKLKAGDALLTLNGKVVGDVLDYLFFEAEETLDLAVQKQNGKRAAYSIEKDAGEPLGLSFGEGGGLAPIPCQNACLFCFVDQLPKGLRPTLYVKDDDYRLSFVSGNYVTLTNAGEEEIGRIIAQKLSPLFVSVHAADQTLRQKMLGRAGLPDLMDTLARLSAAGIVTHAQIVLCPALNDGNALEDTVRRLYALYPSVRSLAVVPVGLTRHRQGLYPLSAVPPSGAGAAIAFCEGFNAAAGANFVFCADEMYQRAGRDLPPYDYYGEFSQIENGVGLLRKFEKEFLDALAEAGEVGAENAAAGGRHTDKTEAGGGDTDKSEAGGLRAHPAAGERRAENAAALAVTGVSAAPFLEGLLGAARKKFPAVRVEVVPVGNTFFGESVTVAGLVTGGDIVRALRGRAKPAKVILPRCMLKEFDTVFLDDMSLAGLERELGAKIEVCPVDGGAFCNLLLSQGD